MAREDPVGYGPCQHTGPHSTMVCDTLTHTSSDHCFKATRAHASTRIHLQRPQTNSVDACRLHDPRTPHAGRACVPVYSRHARGERRLDNAEAHAESLTRRMGTPAGQTLLVCGSLTRGPDVRRSVEPPRGGRCPRRTNYLRTRAGTESTRKPRAYARGGLAVGRTSRAFGF